MDRKRIELYLDSVKGITQGRNPYVASKNPYSMRRRLGSLEDNVKVTSRTFAGWSEKDIKLRNMLKQVVNEYNAKLVVYDMKKNSYILKAYFKGVRELPSVIIGKRIISGQITEKAIRNALSRRKKN